MSRKNIRLTEKLEEYIFQNSVRETDSFQRLREETGKLVQANMQISPEEGQFLGILTKISGAKRIIEIGTFTGYSSLCFASALPPDGKILCCDISEEWTKIARKYWKETGLERKIVLKIGSALETLQAILEAKSSPDWAPGFVCGASSIDLVFLDADKENYPNYYPLILKLLKPGGLLIADNVLWDGSVADVSHQEPSTIGIRKFNELVRSDSNVDVSMIPVADGVSLVRKKTIP
ncbi:O-methyltransferase [Leptospira santarosai]|uniref:SAM-dependent methyltransferase n=1 Tax=Leptospira santarosai TaxID=28183 RepID=A0AB73LV64_9LEPT|nr:class I SAM-dependent methyltransferase [Leptospira santarosai]MBW9232693.1 class I SAM-dependent methyltransferase [Leptospira santarosai]ONF85923.1 SAM-dependent methyltransferase [Leptospira santarosai serovar Grippotyphosa]ONF94017.1 SAM-dependent methyltransferase [Leptospira santarosai]